MSEQVVYNLYHASLLRDNEWSPVVLLNEGLHTYARASGADAVDLGTSTIASVPNESLLHFKRYLGGVASPKLTWNKEL